MTNPDDSTRPHGVPDDQAANEPTQALSGAQPEPTRVIPTGQAEPTIPMSPWARAADGQSSGHDQPAWPGSASPGSATQSATQAPGGSQSYGPQANAQRSSGQQANGQQAYAQRAYGDPTYSQQGYGYGQQAYGPQGYPPPYGTQAYANQQAWTQQYAQQQNQQNQQPYDQQGYQPYAQQGYQQYSQQGYSPHPGYYSPGQYYYVQPQPQQKKRWPVALVAMLLAIVLGGSGFFWAANQLTGASQSPTTIQPSTDPQPGGQSGTDPWQQQEEQSGTTTSKGVSAAQSAGVVLIEAQTSSGLAAGTGMILSADGKVLTNYHVVAGSEKLSVTVADSGDTYSATVLGFDQTKDVALLQLKDASGLTTVKTDTTTPSVGAEIAAVGNAEGGGVLVKASGEVTDTNQDLTVSSDSPWGNTEDLSGLIQTDADAVPGDSGGPMFDSDNEVIGMTTAGSTREGTSYAVPIATALAVVDQVETGQDAGTVRVGPAGYLGIKVADAEKGGSGKTITSVVEDSPAARAGVTAGSRLTKVGDATIRSSTNLATVIRALEPGERVTIEWTAPNGSHKEATVTLGSSPVN
jgi:S1-C subfamily serine protease